MTDRDAWRRELLAPVRRWTPARKAAICMAIKGRGVAIEEVLAAHRLDRSEVETWLTAFASGGADALRIYRRREDRRVSSIPFSVALSVAFVVALPNPGLAASGVAGVAFLVASVRRAPVCARRESRVTSRLASRVTPP